MQSIMWVAFFNDYNTGGYIHKKNVVESRVHAILIDHLTLVHK